MYLVISSSLNPSSRSRVLADLIYQRLARLTKDVEIIDLQDWQLPICDGEGCYADPEVHRLAGLIQNARGIIVATPIYNYDVSAAAKNMVELTGQAWSQKVVGFVCAAGGQVSYMAVMGLANSLMLDFRSLVLPDFVFAASQAFGDDDRVIDANVDKRLTQLAENLVRVTDALSSQRAGEA